MSEDVPGKSNVVYRCTLAICGCTYETCRFSHRGTIGPHNRDSVNRALTRALYFMSPHLTHWKPVSVCRTYCELSPLATSLNITVVDSHSILCILKKRTLTSFHSPLILLSLQLQKKKGAISIWLSDMRNDHSCYVLCKIQLPLLWTVLNGLCYVLCNTPYGAPRK